MLQISSKIAEVVDNVLTQKSETEIWRGPLTTQNWKIHVLHENDGRLLIKVVRRDDGGGDPE